MAAFIAANISIAIYNLAATIFILVCMSFRVFPEHLGLPKGDAGFLIFMALWFAGMIFLWAAVFYRTRALQRGA